MGNSTLKIYFVLGEESGDALGVDLLPALHQQAEKKGAKLEVVGLAGRRLQQEGLSSLFDIEDIAVMGISAVLARLPLIVKRVYQTVADIEAQKPDLIVLIDSPDFTHVVAKRIRKKMPQVPIVNYVCPSVWAWRQGRAKAMSAYVDHVLALLPFEPKALADLGGPAATYVGHPLARQIEALGVKSKPDFSASDEQRKTLLVLPGSRNSELSKMLVIFEQTLALLKSRGLVFDAVLPAVPHLKQRLLDETASWSVQPQIVDAKDNDKHFAAADAALATSGTVTLQLGLHRVPMVSAYKLDRIARPFSFLIKSWSTLLPNLIVDRVLVPEEVNETVLPQRLARRLERLLADTPERAMQQQGFEEMCEKLKTNQPPNELAADVIFNMLDTKL